MDEHRERRGLARLRQKQVEILPRRIAIAKAEFGAAALERFGAKQLRIAYPAGEYLRMFRYPGAIIVFGFVVDIGHRRLPRIAK